MFSYPLWCSHDDFFLDGNKKVRRGVKENQNVKNIIKIRKIKVLLPLSFITYSVVAVAAGSLFCKIETGFSSVNVKPPKPRWSIKLFPTGRSLRTGIPIPSRWSRGPTPKNFLNVKYF